MKLNPVFCRAAFFLAMLTGPVLLGGCTDTYVADWPQANLEVRDYDESPAPGALRDKAAGFDAWHLQWHQPDYGGTVNVRFTDATRTVVQSLGGWGDSTIWTGTYLASQAFRYYVTGDPQARANAVRMVDTLVGHLRVTEAPGYIARYWSPQTSIMYGGESGAMPRSAASPRRKAPSPGIGGGGTPAATNTSAGSSACAWPTTWWTMRLCGYRSARRSARWSTR